jgi:hypothetical protein
MSNAVAIHQANQPEVQGFTVPAAFMPGSFEQAVAMAKMMSEARLVPKDLQGKPADCLLVIEQAINWEASPYAVAQCASVINGKLMFEGKLAGAIINARGPKFGLQSRLRYEFGGSGQQRWIRAFAKLNGAEEEVRVELAKVKTTNAMWEKQPDQQLVYSANRVWGRRHMPELMLGFSSPEEFNVEDLRDVSPQERPTRAQFVPSEPVPETQPVAPSPADPATGSQAGGEAISPASPPAATEQKRTVGQWLADFKRSLLDCGSNADISLLTAAEADQLDWLSENKPQIREEVDALIADRSAAVGG